MKTIKHLIWASATVLLVASCGSKNQGEQTEALLVGVEKATPSTEYNNQPYVGTVEEDESTTASFTGTGTLQSVPVEEGQHVTKGQVIAVLDRVQNENAVKAAKAMLDQAKDAQKRMQQLYDANSLPEMKWVEVESKVQQAQSSYDMAVKSLQDCVLKAPVSGVIGKKYMKSGEVALPSEPIVSILNINKVKVRVSVPETEISKITSHTPTTITVTALNQSFQGGEIEKGVMADAMTHTYDILIHVSNPGLKLLPGMVANVTLPENEAVQQAVITLPVRSVQQDSKGVQFVWVAQNNKAHRQPVSVGQTCGNRIVITSGLSEGAEVITSGYQKVSEGSAIKY